MIDKLVHSGTVVNALFLSALLAFSHALLKYASQHKSNGVVDFFLSNWIAVGCSLAIYGFIFFYYSYILKVIQISTLYPIYTGLSIMLVFLIGVFWFGEKTSAMQCLGAALIIVGVVIVSRGA